MSVEAVRVCLCARTFYCIVFAVMSQTRLWKKLLSTISGTNSRQMEALRLFLAAEGVVNRVSCQTGGGGHLQFPYAMVEKDRASRSPNTTHNAPAARLLTEVITVSETLVT